MTMCLAVFHNRKVGKYLHGDAVQIQRLRFVDIWGWYRGVLKWFGWHIDGFGFIHIYHPDAIDSFRALY
jgi:hypothetical protein